jgi:uncharacterized protein (DUF1800 family)
LIADPARAWAPYDPAEDGPWDLPRVAHLHRRASFAAPWATLERDVRDGVGPSVDRLLDGEATAGDGSSATEYAELMDAMARQLGSGGLARVQGIWLYRMIFTPRPLLERMTLFWHGHFATSDAKVSNPALMQRQNALLREHALGDFKALLVAISRDPAMLIWLDATANRKSHPNENYAREVMELFTLGRGHYTEHDVREAARAFTGGFVARDHYEEIPAQHDDGSKTILGQTGPFRGDDVARILLDQPACAEFVCGKLVKLFVNEVDSPSPELVAPLAKAFRESGYAIRVPVEMILRSKRFHDPASRRTRIKSPVEYTVGTIRALEVLKPTVSAEALAESCSRMGQALFAPPSVAGWDGGPSWINSTTTLARANFALALLNKGDSAFGGRLDPKALAGRHGRREPREAAQFLMDLLVQDAPTPEIRDRILAAATKDKAGPDAAMREVATLILTAPEYQLA